MEPESGERAERERKKVEQNAELKKQVDELENDVITCLQSESGKQRSSRGLLPTRTREILI